VDLKLLEDLGELRALVDAAIISVHRINAINTVGGNIVPWTEEQFDWVENEHLRRIGQLARIVTPPEVVS
jgi:hypothetical protein